MSDNISYTERLWQSSLVGPKEKLNALFFNKNFSDLTISFPRQDIKYKAHRLIMAVSSSIFEGMLFGPMAIEGSVLELPDDNPEAFRIVLGSCYEVDIEPSDIDVTLETFILADKYFMKELGKKCAQIIGRLLNSDNINKVLEFSTHFNLDSYLMEQLVHECANNMGNFLNIENANKVLELFANFNSDSLKTTCIQELVRMFQYSWIYPDKTILCEDKVMRILQDNCCSGLLEFSGCVSANVVRYLIDSKLSKDLRNVSLSFNNIQQAKEIITVLSSHLANYWRIKELYEENSWRTFSFHLRCNMIPTEQLMELSRIKLADDIHCYRIFLFISGVEDHSIEWVLSAVSSLMPGNGFCAMCFPESKLTFSGLKTLLTRLKSADSICYDIVICSPELPLNRQDEVNRCFRSILRLDDFEEDDEQIAIVELCEFNENTWQCFNAEQFY